MFTRVLVPRSRCRQIKASFLEWSRNLCQRYVVSMFNAARSLDVLIHYTPRSICSDVAEEHNRRDATCSKSIAVPRPYLKPSQYLAVHTAETCGEGSHSKLATPSAAHPPQLRISRLTRSVNTTTSNSTCSTTTTSPWLNARLRLS